MVWFFVVPLVLMLVAVVSAARRARERSRGRALATWAATNGWSFQEGDVKAPWRDRVRGLPSHLTVRRMVSGTVDGFPVTIADGRYETHSSHTHTVHDLVITCVQLPGPGPETRVSARTPASNIMRTLGLKEQPSIKTGDANFDYRFAITTDDPQWAAQLFSPGLIKAISVDDVHSWTLHGDELLVVKKERFVAYKVDKYANYIVQMALLILE